MTDNDVLKRVMEFTNGRWASLYDMVERIAPRDRILIALRTIGNDEEYIVRKRNPEGYDDDVMLREYRTFAYGCKYCANRINHFHKASCSLAGKLVIPSDCREW